MKYDVPNDKLHMFDDYVWEIRFWGFRFLKCIQVLGRLEARS
jgi:hypothetical protein